LEVHDAVHHYLVQLLVVTELMDCFESSRFTVLLVVNELMPC